MYLLHTCMQNQNHFIKHVLRCVMIIYCIWRHVAVNIGCDSTLHLHHQNYTSVTILCKISCFQIISYFWKICVRNAASLWHQIQTFVFQVAWQQVDAFYVQRGQVGHHTLHCPVQYNIQIIIIKSITRFLH